MKKITITVEVDGNGIYRNYVKHPDTDWDPIIEDMLSTIEKSNEPMK